MWIFGYGSLVWRVDFPYTEKLIGHIKDYDRQFCHASIDHQGTPEKVNKLSIINETTQLKTHSNHTNILIIVLLNFYSLQPGRVVTLVHSAKPEVTSITH